MHSDEGNNDCRYYCDHEMAIGGKSEDLSCSSDSGTGNKDVATRQHRC